MALVFSGSFHGPQYQNMPAFNFAEAIVGAEMSIAEAEEPIPEAECHH